MFAPELLLPRLNQALANVIAACDAVADGPINDAGETAEQALRTIMRRLLLSQTLGHYSLLAIAGTQGAGKTTLIKSLYDLNGDDAAWLNPNEGRGETYPVLITEGDGDKPAQGFVWKLERHGDQRTVVRVPLLDDTRTLAEAQKAFQDAVSDGNSSELLVELTLPARFNLGKRKGWLLLPGYETRTTHNDDWQSTMRAALTGATGSIVVTDATRLARDQSDLARDAIKQSLEKIEPLVVVTKTEGLREQPEKLDELATRASEVFNVPINRVQCVGIVDNQVYLDRWREELKAKINQFVTASSEDQQGRWHSEMNSLIKQDLKLVLSDINRYLRLALTTRDEANAATELMHTMLEAFDNARDTLRRNYSKKIRGIVDAHRTIAENHLKNHLIEEFEGFRNHVGSFFATDTESLMKLENAVSEADSKAGALGPLVAVGLKEPISKVLNPIRLGQPQATKPRQVTNPVNGKQHEVTPWAQAGNITEPGTPSHALVTLLLPTEGQDTSGKVVGLDDAVKMLPAMTLEWSRVLGEMPEVLGIGTLGDPQHSNVLGAALNGIGPATENAGRLVRTVAATVFTVGLAEVGEAVANEVSDTGGETSGGSSSAKTALGLAGHIPDPVVAGAIAVVAAGFLTVEMLGEVRSLDRANRVAAIIMLQNLSDARHRRYMDVFDDMMEAMRVNLEYAFQRRYHMSDKLAKKDRVVHALTLAQQLREDFSDALEIVKPEAVVQELLLPHA